MLDGKLTLETFTDVMVQRPQIRELIKKVRRYRIASDKVYSGVVGYTDIAIDTARGRFEMRVDRTPGSPAWPMTEPDRVEKFMDCAARVLGAPGARRLLELIQNCRALPDIGQLLHATVPADKRHATERTAQPEPTPH